MGLTNIPNLQLKGVCISPRLSVSEGYVVVFVLRLFVSVVVI